MESKVNIDSSWVTALNEFMKGISEWGMLAVVIFFIGVILTRESRHVKETKSVYDSLFDKFEANLENNNKLVAALDHNTGAIKEMLGVNSTKLDNLRDITTKISFSTEAMHSDIKELLRTTKETYRYVPKRADENQSKGTI